MIYKKNTRTVHNTNNVVIRLSVECDGKQLSDVMPYGDELKKYLASWGNTVEFDVQDNKFIYTAY